MVKSLVVIVVFLTAHFLACSQGKKSVVIGTMVDLPNAILVMNPPNSDQGVLIPQLTTDQRLGFKPTSPQEDGLMVFDATEKSFYYWTADSWVKGLGTAASGDVTGPVNASTVIRIQGRDVSNVLPKIGDALTWNGTSWGPALVAVTPKIQFYSIDPSNFQALEPGGNNNTTLGLFQGSDTFVFAKGNAREIIAPVNLPDGATIQSFTVFYEYSAALGPITINLYRKNLSGGPNLAIGTLVTPLVGLGVQSATAAAVSVVDNSLNSYRVHVAFTNILNITDPALALQRIHGVRIQYTK